MAIAACVTCLIMSCRDKHNEISQAKAELREKGFNVPPDKKSYFDSNCITPVSMWCLHGSHSVHLSVRAHLSWLD